MEALLFSQHMSLDLTKELDVAIQAARSAGAAALDIYETNYQTWEKDNKSPLTEADLAADKIILDHLAQFDHAILSEETDDDLSRLEADTLWIVDPLDGTKDFMKKTGDFSMMIGLVHMGRPVLGVVYKPVKDELYYATKGNGAYLLKKKNNPIRLQVGKIDQPSDLRIVVSRAHFAETDKDIAAALGAESFIKSGSVGIKVGLIADGSCDLYYNTSSYSSEWDSCAPEAILTEAGGIITDIKGNPLEYNKENVKCLNGILASNGPCHSTGVEAIKGVLYS